MASSRKNQFFETSLEKLARTMTRNRNVKVVIEGSVACTDGKTIYLPMMEDVSSELLQDLNGFVDHEAAHIIFTDFSQLGKLVNRFHKELLNHLEDSRIEIKMCERFSGAAINLDRLNEKWKAKNEKIRQDLPWPIRLMLCIREIYDNKPPQVDPQIEPLVAAVTQLAIESRDCQDTKSLREKTEEMIKAINEAREKLAEGLPPMDDEEMEEADKALEQMGKSETPIPLKKDREKKEAKGKGESLDPSAEWENPSEENEYEDGEGEGEGAEANGGSPERGAHANTAKRKRGGLNAEETVRSRELTEDKAKTDSNPRSYQELKDIEKSRLERRKNYATWKDTPEERAMMDESVNTGSSSYEGLVYSPESYVEIQVNKEVAELPSVPQDYRGLYRGRGDKINQSVSLPFSREYDVIINLTGKGNNSELAKRLRIVRDYVRPMVTKLERVLKVKENKKMRFEQERGKLNQRALAKLATDVNYRTPFKNETKTETKNVAVSLVIDCSGSMHGTKMEAARQVALAIGKALEAIGINFEVVGFNTTGSEQLARKSSNLPPDLRDRYNRFGEALRLMVFKEFGRPQLSGICEAHSGGANADGESIVWAAKRLALQPQKRKILMVLSDGQPAYSGANHDVLAGDLKRVIRMLPAAGIEPIGIGILTQDPKEFYPQYVIVDRLEELGTRVTAKLARLIQGNEKF